MISCRGQESHHSTNPKKESELNDVYSVVLSLQQYRKNSEFCFATTAHSVTVQRGFIVSRALSESDKVQPCPNHGKAKITAPYCRGQIHKIETANVQIIAKAKSKLLHLNDFTVTTRVT